jgi:hypothetical protein
VKSQSSEVNQNRPSSGGTGGQRLGGLGDKALGDLCRAKSKSLSHKGRRNIDHGIWKGHMERSMCFGRRAL